MENPIQEDGNTVSIMVGIILLVNFLRVRIGDLMNARVVIA